MTLILALLLGTAAADEAEAGEQGEPESSWELELAFEQISDLHRRFFRAQLPALQEALAPCIDGPAVVQVSYDPGTRVGRIRLQVQASALVCIPEVANRRADLAPLEPLGRSMAGYRDAVANASDLRIANFRVGVELKHTRSCALWLDGQHPPDGTQWSSCVEGRGACSPASPVRDIPARLLKGCMKPEQP